VLEVRKGQAGTVIWMEVPAMLKAQPDEELERMASVCRVHAKRYERVPKEKTDAEKMLECIRREQRRRAVEKLVIH
jgi:hypothetical protein